MELVFFDTLHNLKSISNDDSLGSSLKIFDQHLIIWNINVIEKIKKINSILIPEPYLQTYLLIKEQFPSIQVKYVPTTPNRFSEVSPTIMTNLDLIKLEQMELSLNSVVYPSKDTCDIIIHNLQYPWDLLKLMKDILNDCILESKISSSAKISKTVVIDGPCIIDENVIIDDFCKIKGPIYIGKDSFIGMGSLVRNCMLGRKTSIGFNCEISKSYFSGQTEIAHHNVILDSIIGDSVWFGGYSGTANVLLTKKNVKYEIDNNIVDTGINHFGAVVGNNCAVGAAVIILPGRHVPPNSIIQAGTIFGKK